MHLSVNQNLVKSRNKKEKEKKKKEGRKGEKGGSVIFLNGIQEPEKEKILKHSNDDISVKINHGINISWV